VVHKYDKNGFEVEFVTAEGKTIAVLTLEETAIRSLRGRSPACQVLQFESGPRLSNYYNRIRLR
jgi:hypothetical protein